MTYLNTDSIFFLIIITIGLATTFTDLKSKKIYNLHLAIGLACGLLTMAFAYTYRHESIFFHFLNAIVAFLIGYLMHRSSLWRGGDAKLFVLLALLMPMPHLVYSHALVPGVISLFACSFIAGMIILIPAFIKDIFTHRKLIIMDPLWPARRRAILDACGTVFLSSWLLFPIYYLARITDPFIISIISYLFFIWGYSFKKEVNKNPSATIKKIQGITAFIILGFLMRLWLSPETLSFSILSHFIIRTTFIAVLSSCIYTTFDHFKDYDERVAFAPLLFIGCMLSFTPFLTTLIHLMSQWNIFFTR